jgi:hypothetical protein
MTIRPQKYFRHSFNHTNHIVVPVIVNNTRAWAAYRKYIVRQQIHPINHPSLLFSSENTSTWQFSILFCILCFHWKFFGEFNLIHISPLHCRVCINLRSKLSILSQVAYHIKYSYSCIYTLTDFINALPGNNSVNTVQYAAIDNTLFSMSSAQSSGGTTGLCNPFLSNGSENTLPRKRWRQQQ